MFRFCQQCRAKGKLILLCDTFFNHLQIFSYWRDRPVLWPSQSTTNTIIDVHATIVHLSRSIVVFSPSCVDLNDSTRNRSGVVRKIMLPKVFIFKSWSSPICGRFVRPVTAEVGYVFNPTANLKAGIISHSSGRTRTSIKLWPPNFCFVQIVVQMTFHSHLPISAAVAMNERAIKFTQVFGGKPRAFYVRQLWPKPELRLSVTSQHCQL